MTRDVTTVHARCERWKLLEGGYRVTGRWAWASGSQNCHWLVGGAVGTAVYRASPLQRCLRDIHVATQHAMVAPSTQEVIGSVLLGQEANTVML